MCTPAVEFTRLPYPPGYKAIIRAAHCCAGVANFRVSDYNGRMNIDPTMTTGLPSLDRVLKGFLPGDNVVWQVDTDVEYQALVHPFVSAAVAHGKKVVYFRFARHDSLLGVHDGAESTT